MIDAIENSAYAIWVRESPSIWAFTTILSLHAMGLAIIVGINTIIALRLLGYVPGVAFDEGLRRTVDYFKTVSRGGPR